MPEVPTAEPRYQSVKFKEMNPNTTEGIAAHARVSESQAETVGQAQPYATHLEPQKKEKFLAGTSLCGCTKYQSPVDGQTHCLPRLCLACWCSCFSVGRLYSVLEEKPGDCKFLGLTSTGWFAAFAYLIFLAMFGLGCLFPIFISAAIAERYKTQSPSGADWFKVYCKSVFCIPCFLVQLRNFVEFKEHKTKLGDPRPVQQQNMV